MYENEYKVMSETKVIDIKELKFDEHNFNRHNDEGMALLSKSISQNGYGRSDNRDQ